MILGRLLDVGCSISVIPSRAAKNGLAAVGLDLDPEAIQKSEASCGEPNELERPSQLPSGIRG